MTRGPRSAQFVIPSLILVVSLAAACAKSPGVELPAPVTFDTKVEWILRLENQRVLRDAPDVSPTADSAAASPSSPRAARVAPRPQPDLVALLADPEPQLRRRAALAIGRVGLQEGVGPLIVALADPELEVRQMSAFALGLLGSPLASDALAAALSDPEPVVQGRAAQALVELVRSAARL